MSALWHPFASMGRVEAEGEFVIERGEGSYVWDVDGKRYVDAIASLWYCNIGYGRTEIADAVADQLSNLHAYHTFGEFATPPAIALADRIAAIAPMPDAKVFFASGGSDAVDTAAKMIRRYWTLRGHPQKTTMVFRERAYHGMHAYGTSLAGIEPNREQHGPLIKDVLRVPWDSADGLRAAIEHAEGRVGGFYCEPVVGAGGVLLPPEGYLKEAREICAEHDVLFVADEVITGFGRMGDWFASTRFGLDPDLILFAKGVTSGYLPLGGVIASATVAEPFWSEDLLWRHGYTYSGHSAACVAGLVNLDIMEREDLHKVGLVLEGDIAEALEPLVDNELVTEVRAGLGVLAAVQLDADAVDADPTLPGRAFRAGLEHGVISRILTGWAYQVSPPLVISREQIGEMASGFAAAVESLG